MSIRLVAAVLGADLTPPSLKLTAIALANAARDPDGTCYPSVDHLRRTTGLSARRVQSYLAELRTIGFLEVLRPATGHRSPLYRLHQDALQALPEPAKQPPVVDPRDEAGDTPGMKLAAPQPALGVTPTTPLNDAGDTPGVTPTTPLLRGTVMGTVTEPSQDARPRNLWWDALEDVFGYRPTGSEAKVWGRLVKRLEADGADPAEIRIRAIRLVAQWGPSRLTVHSLEKWWDRFGAEIGTLTEADQARYVDEIRKARRRQEIHDAANNGTMMTPRGETT